MQTLSKEEFFGKLSKRGRQKLGHFRNLKTVAPMARANIKHSSASSQRNTELHTNSLFTIPITSCVTLNKQTNKQKSQGKQKEKKKEGFQVGPIRIFNTQYKLSPEELN